MPFTVTIYTIEELAKGSEKNRILLETKQNTEIDIVSKADGTVISFPFGNRFDIINGKIVVYEK